MDNPNKRELLTTKQACEYLGSISDDILADRRRAGEVAYYKLGGRYYYSKEDLDAYIERSRVPAREKVRTPAPPPKFKSAVKRGPGRPPNRPPRECEYYPGMKVV